MFLSLCSLLVWLERAVCVLAARSAEFAWLCSRYEELSASVLAESFQGSRPKVT